MTFPEALNEAVRASILREVRERESACRVAWSLTDVTQRHRLVQHGVWAITFGERWGLGCDISDLVRPPSPFTALELLLQQLEAELGPVTAAERAEVDRKWRES